MKKLFAKILARLFRGGCEYCGKYGEIKSIPGEDVGYGEVITEQFFYIEGNRIVYFREHADGSGCDDYATIKRCPICGKRLRGGGRMKQKKRRIS